MILFLDLETTGLSVQNDAILEIACLVTDDQLEETNCEYQATLKWDSSSHKTPIDPKVVAMHTNSGLWTRCMASSKTLKEVDDELFCLLTTHWKGIGDVAYILAGNSVWFDRGFVARDLPRTHALLHHRQIDVSTMNEMAKRMWPALYESRPQGMTHQAMDDVKVSLAGARHYAKKLTCRPEFKAGIEVGDYVHILDCTMSGANGTEGTVVQVDPDPETTWRFQVKIQTAGEHRGRTFWCRSVLLSQTPAPSVGDRVVVSNCDHAPDTVGRAGTLEVIHGDALPFCVVLDIPSTTYGPRVWVSGVRPT